MSTHSRHVPVSAKVARGVVRTYQIVVSPTLHLIAGPGAGCRFLPGCSDYALEALSVHGVFRGSWLTARRLCKCGPWHRGGWDPVPPSRTPEPDTKKSGKASTG